VCFLVIVAAQIGARIVGAGVVIVWVCALPGRSAAPGCALDCLP